MNTLSILGYLIAMCLAPVAPFIVVRWVKRSASAVKALRVLSREQRAGETLYDTAEAIAGDAHNWRGMTLPNEYERVEGRTHRNGQSVDVEQVTIRAALDGLTPSNIAERRNLESRLVAPQPSPKNSDGPALWPMIISELGHSETDRLVALDMQQRHEFGVAKYGVPLVASNGRDHLTDAYQEALDGVVYLRATIESMHDPMNEQESIRFGRMRQLYVDMLDMAKEIRELIHERDGQ